MKARFLHLINILIVLWGVQAAAQHHDENQHQGWPEGTILTLEGQDSITKNECLLFVTEVGFLGPEQTTEQFFAVIQTNYAHDNDHPAPVTIKTVNQKPGVLAGTGSNGKDQIAVFLEPSNLDLRNIKSFNLKWLHGNHFHTNRCVNMKVHDHKDEHK